MKIYNKYFKLETINNEVIYNQKKILYSSYYELYELLCKYIKRKKIDYVLFDGDYEPLSNIEQIVFMSLSNFYNAVFSTKYLKFLDITFSYNFQLSNQKWIIPQLFKMNDKAFNNNMITLADSNDYIVRTINKNDEYEKFYKKFGYYIRRGDNVFEIKNCNLDFSLKYWNNYCEKKHKKSFSEEAIDVYLNIYNNLGFNSIKILYNDNIVATSVYYRDENNRIIYFCITGWDEKFKKYSPGIYLYSKWIEFCHYNNYKFSFCYGKQKYKIDLLKFFGEE